MSKGDFRTLGASAHALESREVNDFYATDPIALEKFLDESGIELRNVWECACGEGHLAKVLKERGLLGQASDVIDRGYEDARELDFYFRSDIWDGDILTNPPYGDAQKFCQHSLDSVDEGSKVVMLMRIQFLEGKKRKPFLKRNPPKYVYVSSSRLRLAKGGDFEKYDKPSANCYAWYVWEKGYTGNTMVKWFN
jgi:hypothetical protein